MNADRKFLGRFRRLSDHHTCEGGSGTIYWVSDQAAGETVVIKAVHGARGSREAQEGVSIAGLREALALGRLPHPNIVRMRERHYHKNSLYLVLETAAADLGQAMRDVLPLLDEGGPAPPGRGRGLVDTRRFIYLQCLRGLAHMHSRGFVHRDVKLANFLLMDDGAIKLCDLGLARPVSLFAVDTGNVGTRTYQAPESLLAARRSTFASDVWALGICFAEIILGCDGQVQTFYDACSAEFPSLDEGGFPGALGGGNGEEDEAVAPFSRGHTRPLSASDGEFGLSSLLSQPSLPLPPSAGSVGDSPGRPVPLPGLPAPRQGAHAPPFVVSDVAILNLLRQALPTPRTLGDLAGLPDNELTRRQLPLFDPGAVAGERDSPVSPPRRPCLPTVLRRHGATDEEVALVMSMLSWSPLRRPPAAALMGHAFFRGFDERRYRASEEFSRLSHHILECRGSKHRGQPRAADGPLSGSEGRGVPPSAGQGWRGRGDGALSESAALGVDLSNLSQLSGPPAAAEAGGLSASFLMFSNTPHAMKQTVGAARSGSTLPRHLRRDSACIDTSCLLDQPDLMPEAPLANLLPQAARGPLPPPISAPGCPPGLQASRQAARERSPFSREPLFEAGPLQPAPPAPPPGPPGAAAQALSAAEAGALPQGSLLLESMRQNYISKDMLANLSMADVGGEAGAEFGAGAEMGVGNGEEAGVGAGAGGELGATFVESPVRGAARGAVRGAGAGLSAELAAELGAELAAAPDFGAAAQDGQPGLREAHGGRARVSPGAGGPRGAAAWRELSSVREGSDGAEGARGAQEGQPRTPSRSDGAAASFSSSFTRAIFEKTAWPGGELLGRAGLQDGEPLDGLGALDGGEEAIAPEATPAGPSSAAGRSPAPLSPEGRDPGDENLFPQVSLLDENFAGPAGRASGLPGSPAAGPRPAPGAGESSLLGLQGVQNVSTSSSTAQDRGDTACTFSAGRAPGCGAEAALGLRRTSSFIQGSLREQDVGQRVSEWAPRGAAQPSASASVEAFLLVGGGPAGSGSRRSSLRDPLAQVLSPIQACALRSAPPPPRKPGGAGAGGGRGTKGSKGARGAKGSRGARGAKGAAAVRDAGQDGVQEGAREVTQETLPGELASPHVPASPGAPASPRALHAFSSGIEEDAAGGVSALARTPSPALRAGFPAGFPAGPESGEAPDFGGTPAFLAAADSVQGTPRRGSSELGLPGLASGLGVSGAGASGPASSSGEGGPPSGRGGPQGSPGGRRLQRSGTSTVRLDFLACLRPAGALALPASPVRPASRTVSVPAGGRRASLSAAELEATSRPNSAAISPVVLREGYGLGQEAWECSDCSGCAGCGGCSALSDAAGPAGAAGAGGPGGRPGAGPA